MKSQEKFEIEQNRLIATYEITSVHACCYMCNYEDDFICHQHNNGCDSVEECRRIYEKEKLCQEQN